MRPIRALSAAVLLLPLSVWAGPTFYVTDELEITLRSGPGLDFKILRMLPTGTVLERLGESEGWVQVRTPAGDEGWVVGRYVSPSPPKGPLLRAAREEVEALRAETSQLRSDLASARSEADASSAEARRLKGRLASLEKEFARWKEEHADVVGLRQRAEALAAEQKTTRSELARLTSENKSLAAREKFYWFFSGAVVLLLGWVLGYLYAASRYRVKRAGRFKV